MKIKPTLLGILFMSSYAVFGQEFSKNANGLIYSDKAIGKLKHIVDSLNLKFIHCENRIFSSVVQQRTKTITVTGSQSLEIKRAIDAGKSFEEIAITLPDSIVNRNNLVIRIEGRDYDDTPTVIFNLLKTNDEYESITYFGADVDKYKNVEKGWIYDYKQGSESQVQSLFAVYIDGVLTSYPLPEKYSRLVQYSEHLIDPSCSIFFKTLYQWQMKYKDTERVHAFHQFIYKTLKRPECYIPDVKVKRQPNDTTIVVATDNGEYYEEYLKALTKWESTRVSEVEKLFKKYRKFRKEFYALYALAKSDEVEVDEEFEQYVEKFVSPKEALWLKRNRIVMRWCGMDSSPGRHVLAIAELAGETAEWEIFLRAHLDIMNDHFQRVSDGSYAWNRRNTYIKELEVLDINVPNLLLGICLRVNDASDNHYYGSISRIGRSLAESKDRIAIKQQMLEMVKDNKLDDFNRLMMFYTLNNYIHFLADTEEKKREWEELKVAMQSMPEYIRPVSIGSD